MIEAKIPKDIRSYKTKIMGPLTFRQLICAVIVVVLDAVLIFGVFRHIDMEPRLFILIGMIVDTPILMFCFEPGGIPMEKYLKTIITLNFIYPAKRKPSKVLREKPKPSMNEKERKKHEKELSVKYKQHPEFKPYK